MCTFFAQILCFAGNYQKVMLRQKPYIDLSQAINLGNNNTRVTRMCTFKLEECCGRRPSSRGCGHGLEAPQGEMMVALASGVKSLALVKKFFSVLVVGLKYSVAIL